MFPRLITKKIHSYLDYPVAAALMGLPFVLGLGSLNPAALWLSVIVGVAALILTLITDHQLGVFRVVSYRIHLAVDLLVGITFVFAPFLLGFSGIDAWYYWLNATAILFVVGMHRPESAESTLTSGARSHA